MSAHAIARHPIVPGWVPEAVALTRRLFADAVAAAAPTPAQIAAKQAQDARRCAERIAAYDRRMAAELMAAADHYEQRFER